MNTISPLDIFAATDVAFHPSRQKTVAGFSSPNVFKACKRLFDHVGVFFASACRMVDCAGDPSGSPVSLNAGTANLAQSAMFPFSSGIWWVPAFSSRSLS